MRAGNGYAGVHSASDTEYDWTWYGGLVGAYFQSHPAIQSGRIKIEDAAHPSTQALPTTWMRTDEWYDFRTNPRGRVHVLATLDETSYQGGGMGADHPIAWCQAYDGGRAWYTAGGHTRESYSEPLFRQHLLGGIEFAAGLKPGKCETLAAVSSASYRGERLARDSIVSLFGKDLAVGTQSAGVTPLPTTLAGTSLQIKDSTGVTQLAPLFFASPGQMNWLLPANISNGAATLTLLRADGTRPSATINVTNVAPALFAANGNGQGAAAGLALRVRPNFRAFVPLAQFDQTLNRYVPLPLEFTAPDEELFLVLFGTGLRAHSGLTNVSLRVGGTSLPILYAGAQGEFLGLDQVNAQIPR
ncbi:MAG TPA: ThuA domain-containing protein, partial [Roseiflexaceae bacterium]|nr:ThuA domain-containing protein [Roseiflexaceae bacterium]